MVVAFILGGASWGATYGLGGIWYGFACGLGLLLLGVTLAKPMRALALYTVPDVLEMRYKSKTIRLLAATLSLLALVGILGAQVWAASAVFEAIGLPGTAGAVFATLIFIAYTAFSGLWAVALTDFIQVILGSVGVLIAVILGLNKVGGFGGLRASLANVPNLPQATGEYFNFTSLGFSLLALTLAATVMYTLIGQDFYQRLFASKDEGTARKGAIYSGLLLMALSILPALAGMLALALSNDPQAIIDSPKTAVPKLVITVFGSGVGAIFVAAILAAVMSTADSLLSAATSHVVKDFYQSFAKEADDRKLLRLSIVTTVVIGLLSLVAALTIQGIVELLIYSYDIYTSGVFVPLILGIYWKRATKEGALLGMLAGSLTAIVGIAGLVSFSYWEYIYVSGALVSAVVMIVASLLTAPKAIEREFEEAFEPG
ncbi:sodium:solute symporter family protein [Palaeococcus ferrophilus]|uniref:sodium:solute symporter family protein n=1 Tax=Palaeococcus ferrophilus TaxID=83868 RepID=UPI000A0674DB|nr:sodium:solute symporter family protein [Palaeococcus ferrophilus]